MASKKTRQNHSIQHLLELPSNRESKLLRFPVKEHTQLPPSMPTPRQVPVTVLHPSPKKKVIMDRALSNALMGTNDTSKLPKLTLIYPLLAAGDVEMPSVWLPSYGKSTADCHFGITTDFFINGTGLRTGALGILMSESPPLQLS
ncbi:hypothetical protein PUN28_007395 [Cardiocondyla obscurior]|uniref:Uncharacterized protein n=1 Tax=Cardiocondyla obscurior TaxID=286306 RepID=A0AAW2G5B7_9HYME